MRIFSLIQLIVALLVFGLYYYFIEPKVEATIWLEFLLFVLVFLTLSFVFRRVERYFKSLDKRIEP